MALPAVATVNALLDRIGLERLHLLGVTSQPYGMGVPGSNWGQAKDIADGQADLLASADGALINALLSDYLQAATYTSGETVAAGRARERLESLDAHIRERAKADGINAVDGILTYLTYYNVGAGGTWTALQDVSFKEVFTRFRKGLSIDKWNLYQEILQGSTYANGLRKEIVGTGETAGATVSSDAAGGFPKLKTASFSGSSDTVEVTGTEYNPVTKISTAGKTWTATVSANGTVVLTPGGGNPASANALISASSAIAAGANIGAGTILYVEAHRPTARLLPL